MEKRKIQKVGYRSYSICLPKGWVQRNSLGEKSEVGIEYSRNDELMILAREPRPKSRNLEIEVSKIQNLAEFLVFCYVKNIDSITIRTGKFDYEASREIKSTIKYLEGYDITYEDSSKITISFLFKEMNISLTQIMRRMNHLISVMISALKNKDLKVLEETETAVDRLYHLSKRIIIGCVNDSRKREENQIYDQTDLFFMNIIFKKLENIADNIHSLKGSQVQKKEMELLEKISELLNDMVYSKRTLKEIKEKLLKLKEQGRNSDRMIKDTHKQSMDLLENFMSLKLNKELENYF